MEQDYIVHNGKKYEYYIIRKRIKNIYMRIDKNKNIIISAPKKVSNKYLGKFVESKISWVEKQLNYYDSMPNTKEQLDFENDELTYYLGKQYKLKIIPSKENSISCDGKYLYLRVKEQYIHDKKYKENAYEKCLKSIAMELLTSLVIVYQDKLKEYKIPMPTVEIRKMKSKWGCCIPSKKHVKFNLKLMNSPLYCIEYVVIHELAHFKYQNHSKDFYRFIEIFMPDWKERRKILNKKYGRVV